MTHRPLRFDEIDHVAGLHAKRLGMAETDDLDGVAASAQHVLGRLRLEPGDQAGDLAGTDVKRGDERGAPRRQRLHFRGQAVIERAHALPPFGFCSFFLAASSRAWTAPSDRRTVMRSASLRSMAAMSRPDNLLSRSSATN